MNAPNPSLAKFRLGHIVATPNTLTRLADDDILTAIQRHQSGDWGDVPEEDRQENELSQQGFRLLSMYSSAQGVKSWIITKAGRSSTCVLLPGVYLNHASQKRGGFSFEVQFHPHLGSPCRKHAFSALWTNLNLDIDK
jgi:hypothetical protein